MTTGEKLPFIGKSYKGRKKQGELIVGTVLKGEVRHVLKVRKHKDVPKGCSVPRQLCLKCRQRIHKRDANYESKICKACTGGQLG